MPILREGWARHPFLAFCQKRYSKQPDLSQEKNDTLQVKFWRKGSPKKIEDINLYHSRFYKLQKENLNS